ncbi:hypothetical protein [Hymenobacter antarcticus]|uniref:J domain-containing protein n=1 Tax=Hymenobacter antarcticus TaxID=486270 RepID=A0ABP7QMN7_9BACT
MKNPYEILGVSQDATGTEIILGLKKAQVENLKTKRYQLAELQAAQRQLQSPAKRLVADFLYPSRPKAKRPKNFVLPIDESPVSFTSLAPDAYSSL